jgi:hypothetical protein
VGELKMSIGMEKKQRRKNCTFFFTTEREKALSLQERMTSTSSVPYGEEGNKTNADRVGL